MKNNIWPVVLLIHFILLICSADTDTALMLGGTWLINGATYLLYRELTQWP